jgi:hypothetical protein
MGFGVLTMIPIWGGEGSWIRPGQVQVLTTYHSLSVALFKTVLMVKDSEPAPHQSTMKDEWKVLRKRFSLAQLLWIFYLPTYLLTTQQAAGC